MIEIQLSTRSITKPIAVFDGRVVELFSEDLRDGSRRIHIGHMKSIEITPGGINGEKFALQIKGEYQLISVDVSEAALPKVQELVATVQEAMAALEL